MATFSFDALKEVRWKNLSNVLALLPGDKVLLVDPYLLSALDRVANMTLLRKLGVTNVFKIDDLPPKQDRTKIAYLLPPTHTSVTLITKHLQVDKDNAINRTRLVIFVPKETPDIHYLLESRGLFGPHLCTASLSLGWIPVDTDLVTLDLSALFSDFYSHGDHTWPHYMGLELGELLELGCDSDLAPLGCRVHALGEAAEVVASGMRLYCIRSGLTRGAGVGAAAAVKRKAKSHLTSKYSSDYSCELSSASSTCSSSSVIDSSTSVSGTSSSVSSPPLVVIFSRNLDYVTPLLIPMTFEALIHEVIGIEMGVLELPESVCADKSLRKQTLHSEKMEYYKNVRDLHVANVHAALDKWRAGLKDTHSGLELELNTRFSMPKIDGSSNHHNSNVTHLKSLGSQVGPLVAKRRELSFFMLALNRIMDRMTKEDSVEDLRAAQTILLKSGTGDALATDSSQTATGGNEGDHRSSSKYSGGPKAGGACGTSADDVISMPIRLALEWLSTYRGEHLIDGVRMLSLASVTHDGLSDQIYTILHRAVLHTAGQTAYPMMFALRQLNLLVPRSSSVDHQSSHLGGDLDDASDPLTTRHLGATAMSSTIKSTNWNLPTAVTRLSLPHRRKSIYNRLHYLLHLSHHEQTNRSVEHSPISPTYVYGGQHCPIVVRLTESIWASCLDPFSYTSADTSSSVRKKKTMLRSMDAELISDHHLKSALKVFGMSDQASSTLGFVSLSDPSLPAAGYQSGAFLNERRANAPLAHPLPLLAVHQPVIVVFPGGCTYGEVAALRFVALRRHWKLLIATSCLLTSRDLLQQAGQGECIFANGES